MSNEKHLTVGLPPNACGAFNHGPAGDIWACDIVAEHDSDHEGPAVMWIGSDQPNRASWPRGDVEIAIARIAELERRLEKAEKRIDGLRKAVELATFRIVS